MKTFILIALFVLWGLFLNAGYGANEKRQKKVYYIIAIIIWIILLFLANFLL